MSSYWGHSESLEGGHISGLQRGFRNTPIPKYFGGIVMKRDQFDEIRSCIHFFYQLISCHNRVSSDAHWWNLVNYSVEEFSNNWEKNTLRHTKYVLTSQFLMLWIEGFWMNICLLFYVEMDIRPEKFLEVQDLCYGVSRLKMRLKFKKIKIKWTKMTKIHIFFIEPMYWKNLWNLGWILTALLLHIRVLLFSLVFCKYTETI